MALRLAGTPFLAIQGTDNQGWVREVTSLDTLPGLKIDQQGTGRVFDYQDGGVSRMFMEDGGKVLLANGAGPPSAPDTHLHIWDASAGSVDAASDTLLTLENDGIAALSFLTPATGIGRVNFGDPGSAARGQIQYEHTTDRFRFVISDTIRLFWSAGALAFQEPTAISTTTGDLTLDPAGKVALGSGKLITGWGTQTTVGAAGAASALPANPTGYVKIDVGGTTYVTPYYAAA